MVHFPVNAKKATHAVARLLEKSGAPVDYLRISKLIYLSDRESLKLRGVPIVGGHYYSMHKGPMIGEVMDFVGERNAPDWRHFISPRYGSEIRLQAKSQAGSLSASELNILDGVVEQHSSRTTEELVQWCHKNCSEYEEVPRGQRKTIKVEAILESVGKSQKAIRNIVREAESLAKLDALMA